MGKYDSANNCDLTVCITLAEYRDLIQDAEWRRNRISELENACRSAHAGQPQTDGNR